jgi:putative flippase GtrA
VSTRIGVQALRFAAVGALNTAVGLCVILGSMALLGLGDVAANALGYACGLAVSFVGNRTWTFGDRGPWIDSLPRFLGVFAVAYGLNLVALFFVRDHLQVNSYLAQAVAIVVYTVSFFVGSRTFAFRKVTRASS